MLARTKLDLPLEQIVSAQASLRDAVLRLVKWAETRNRLPELVRGAREENPRHPDLLAFAGAFFQEVDLETDPASRTSARDADAGRAMVAPPLRMRTQLDPPANDEDFERLCRDLWAAVWQDPTAQRHGRSGQTQHGVDVYGNHGHDGRYSAVQCKLRDRHRGSRLTQRELEAEATAAREFTPRLRELIVCHTGPNDARLESMARDLTNDHAQEDPHRFSVHVWGWENLTDQLWRFPEVLYTHYPHLAPGANST